MAAVTINIPNIGNVTADNAASEETLQKILAAMQKQASGKKVDSKEEKDLKKAREDETKQIKQGMDATKKASTEQEKTNKASSAFGNYLKGIGTNASQGFGMASTALMGFGKTLASTAISVATAFATSYEQMAKDPIGAASTLLATNIDLAGAGLKAGVDVANGGIHALAGALGPFSGIVTGASDAMAAATKAAIDFAAGVLKVANNVFANEFKKSAQMLHDFTKSGASFAGGMIEMRDVAHSSGLMMDQFSNIVKASGENIRAMGMNQADGAMAVAGGMKSLQSTIGKSGGSIRDELLAMGYTYEEQGQIVADYGAQLKASGKDIRNIAPAELATQVKDYAKNLKVLSDITGQDAKKLMEKARQESMRGALMNKLTSEQKDAFKGAHAAMAGMGPEFQKALMQMLSGETVTDPMIAGNAEAMEMIKKVASDVQSGNKDIVADTQSAMSQAADATRKRIEAEGSATDQAVLLGNNIGGAVAGFAEVSNKLAGFTLAEDAARKSGEAAEKQSVAQDGVTKGYQDVTRQMNDFGQQMEKMATDNLPTYAGILAKNAKETAEAMQEAIKFIKDPEGYTKAKAKEMGGDEDKVGGALAGAAAGAATGAVIGSVVPVIGTAVGTAVGGIVGAASGWFLSGKKKDTGQDTTSPDWQGAAMAAGGIMSAKPGGTLVNFAEAGMNEAGVPLPDGKRIPVDMPMGELLTGITGLSNNITPVAQQMTMITSQLTPVLDKINATLEQMNSTKTESTGVFSTLSSHLEELKTTATKQLDAHEQMKRTLADSKDNLSGILNNIM